MQEQLILFETAKLAKEKGFNEPCWEAYGVYSQLGDLKGNECLQTSFENEFGGTFDRQDYDRDNFYLAPTQSLLQRWLREVHNVECYAYPYKDHQADNNDPFEYRASRLGSQSFETFEEALENDLQDGLKLIKTRTL